ncbi:MAG: molybdenum ABC transporter ATP-binding protein [Pseudomonadota bacterium]
MTSETSDGTSIDGKADFRMQAEFRGSVGSFPIDVAFDVPMSGVTALFGPSGSGKTTVLRCIAGLTQLTGRFSIGDETWQDDTASAPFQPAHVRPVGYVFQDARLFSHLDVRRNLMFGARRARRASPSHHAPDAIAFDDVVALLDLGDLLERAVDKLSGGEQQRVSIARALLSRPRILLMDEPLSGVDRARKDEVLPYIEQLSRALSIPVIYVSHDIAEVSRLADWMVLMARGRVTAQGPLDALLSRLDLNPDTGRFEAGVVITARVTGVDDDYRSAVLDFEGEQLLVPGLTPQMGASVRLRIRARDVAIAIERPTGLSIRNIVSGEIVSLVAEPDSAFAEVLIAVGQQRLRARLTRHAVDELGLVIGTPAYALIKSVAFDSRATVLTETEIDAR